MAADSARQPQILVVDDDESEGLAVARAAVGRDCCALSVSPCGQRAMDELARRDFDMVVLAACKPGQEGLCLLIKARAIHSSAQVIVIAADDNVRTAVNAMQMGATDYITRPFEIGEVVLRCERALRQADMHREVARLRRRSPNGTAPFIGTTRTVDRVLDLAEQVAPTRVTVLLSGETGTGKELMAHIIHELSPRRGKKFVPVSCSAVPEQLLESEFFGHTKGSFTGAVVSQSGLFEQAASGTLFLDEIETLTLPMQAKLLRAVEERTIQRVGAAHDMPIDFRLVAASNVDLQAEVAGGRFREDLWFRLNVFPIQLPPLRERRADIPLLVLHFRDTIAADLGMEPVDIPEPVMEGLSAYDWPGNVRELRNWVERALVVATSGPAAVPPPPAGGPGPHKSSWDKPINEGWSLDRLQQEYIGAVLDHTHGHRSQAADILGIDRRTLYRKIRRPTH